MLSQNWVIVRVFETSVISAWYTVTAFLTSCTKGGSLHTWSNNKIILLTKCIHIDAIMSYKILFNPTLTVCTPNVAWVILDTRVQELAYKGISAAGQKVASKSEIVLWPHCWLQSHWLLVISLSQVLIACDWIIIRRRVRSSKYSISAVEFVRKC